MDFDTKHKLQGIQSVISSLHQELFMVALRGAYPSKIRKSEWAETLRSLADRVERIPEEDRS